MNKLTQYPLLLACVGMALTAHAQAQLYPIKPIRFIVPFAPGGGADIIARLVSARLTDSLKQQIVIDNRAGAGGNIGAEIAAFAPADGYTMSIASANLAMNLTLYGKQRFDPLRDFAPVTLLASTANLLAVHPSLPAKTVRELIALAKASPGKLNYASGGSGSTPHLTAELLKTMAGIDLLHVPYKGTGPAVIGLLGGEASLALVPALSILPHVKTGRVRALAISSARRATALPDIPTVAESGVPGYEASQWYGVVVPAGTPATTISLLNSALVKLVRAPDFVARMVSDASTPEGTTPQQFGAYLRDEIAKWSKIVKFAGARVE